ncbi:hypothetical protein SAMD00019534_105990, partial [Acytostelium subglobosum LB1]|uniref:hypothetical protein n=1 Tax=Acytostelium subglobosum LB1 TaxID=1410327 RepID=UPI000645094A
MNRHSITALMLLVAISVAHSQTYTSNWTSINSRPNPAWYDEAKFGIFIHWGVYSVPHYADLTDGAEWYWYCVYNPDMDGGLTAAYHNKTYGPGYPYQNFAPYFKASMWNPDDWANLFVQSGAKYVVLTSKHHEGYTLWDSPQAWGWNSVDIGPGMDLVGMLTKSVKNAGLKMGLYHSLYEWFNPLYLADKASGSPPLTDDYVVEVLQPQLRDIVNRYEPSVVWADGEWEQLSEYWESTDFISWLYSNSSVKDDVVVNDRWGSETRGVDGGFYTGGDRYNPLKLIGHKWENCYTIGSSWGYDANEDLAAMQNISSLLWELASTVSCGGNLLLDVGPTEDGLIPWIMQERLLQMGQWLSYSGDAIYKSSPWRIQNDTEAMTTWYTVQNTTGVVYAMVFGWPEDNVLILETPITTKETEVAMLGCTNAASQCNKLKFTGNGPTRAGIKIQLPLLNPIQYPPFGVYTFALSNIH